MIYILLPCFNEFENLEKIIKKINLLSIKSNYKFIIIIVNDGSKDRTKKEIKNIKKNAKNKILYLEHKRNMGLNIAMYTGLQKFLKIANVKDIIISLDSDNTHPISLIPKMIKPLKDKKCDVVIASRFQIGSDIYGLSLFRKCLSESARFIFKLFFSIKNVEDYTCNFRAYNYRVLKNSNLIKKSFFIGKDFSIIADLLINLSKNSKKIIIKEVPLKLRYDFKIGKSKLNVTRNIIKTLYLVLRNLF